MASEESDEKRVTIVIDKNLDYKFRKMASQKFRFEPKWYSKAMEEAVNLWIDQLIYGLIRILMRILNSFLSFALGFVFLNFE